MTNKYIYIDIYTLCENVLRKYLELGSRKEKALTHITHLSVYNTAGRKKEDFLSALQQQATGT